MIWLSSR